MSNIVVWGEGCKMCGGTGEGWAHGTLGGDGWTGKPCPHCVPGGDLYPVEPDSDDDEAALVVAKDDLALAESKTLWGMVARLCTCDYALPPLEPEQHGSDCCYRKLLKVVDERTPTIAVANELMVKL